MSIPPCAHPHASTSCGYQDVLPASDGLCESATVILFFFFRFDKPDHFLLVARVILGRR